MFDTVKDFMRGLSAFGREMQGVGKRSVGGNFDPTFFNSSSGVGRITASDIVNQPYKHHAWTFACGWVIAKNVSRLPMMLIDEKNPAEPIRQDPILDLFQHPNSIMTQVPFLQSIILHLLLPSSGKANAKKNGGQAFIVPLGATDFDAKVDLTRGIIPKVLMPFNDSAWKPKIVKKENGFGGLTGWIYDPMNKPMFATTFGTNEIIRIYNFNPYDALAGLANYTPTQLAVWQDIRSDIYNSSVFENNAIPAGVLSTEQKTTKAQNEEMMRSWYETYGGAGNAQKVAIVSGGMKYQHIGLTNVDMQYEKMKENVKEKIIAGYGLNKIALGMYEKINMATIREGNKILWEGTYLPMAEVIEDAFNAQFIRFAKPGFKLKFDTSKVRALRPDFTAQTKVAASMVKDMNMPTTLASKIAQIPLTEQDVIDYPWLDMNPLEVKQEFAIVGIGANFEPRRKAVKVVGETIDKDAFWWDYIERILDPAEKEFKKRLVKFFLAEREIMEDNVDAWLKQNTKSIRATELELSDILPNKFEENKKLTKLFKSMTSAQVIAETAKMKEEIGGTFIEWSVKDDYIDAMMKRRRKQILGINTTTFKKARGKIADAIEESLKEGLTPQETAKRVKKAIRKVGEIRKNQSQMIARTEVGTVSSQTRNDIMKAEGYGYHEWVTARDKDVRDSHVPMDGQIEKVGTFFTTGDGNKLRFPLDPRGKPGEIINCRCVTVIAEKP